MHVAWSTARETGPFYLLHAEAVVPPGQNLSWGSQPSELSRKSLQAEDPPDTTPLQFASTLPASVELLLSRWQEGIPHDNPSHPNWSLPFLNCVRSSLGSANGVIQQETCSEFTLEQMPTLTLEGTLILSHTIHNHL